MLTTIVMLTVSPRCRPTGTRGCGRGSLFLPSTKDGKVLGVGSAATAAGGADAAASNSAKQDYSHWKELLSPRLSAALDTYSKEKGHQSWAS